MCLISIKAAQGEWEFFKEIFKVLSNCGGFTNRNFGKRVVLFLKKKRRYKIEFQHTKEFWLAKLSPIQTFCFLFCIT